MNLEEINKALKELIVAYQEMENEYGIDLSREVLNVEKVIEDIPEAVWKSEYGCKLWQ